MRRGLSSQKTNAPKQYHERRAPLTGQAKAERSAVQRAEGQIATAEYEKQALAALDRMAALRAARLSHQQDVSSKKRK
jgi:hypothetical protein